MPSLCAALLDQGWQKGELEMTAITGAPVLSARCARPLPVVPP